MEFLENAADEDEDDEGKEDDDDSSFYGTAPLPPVFSPVAMETLQLHYNYSQREEQAAAATMGGGARVESFGPAPKDYYTLRLRGNDPQEEVETWWRL